MEKKNNKVRALPPYLILVYLLVASFVLTGVSFAQYGVSSNKSASGTAAKFQITASGAGTVDSLVYLKSDTDSPSSQQMSYIEFEVTSVSEVPVTYDITITAPTGKALQDGVEWYLTPIDKDASNYSTVLSNAYAGKKTGGSHTHRPNGASTVTFTGCGIAPAGTHTQHYVLHMHFETEGNVTNSGNYTFTGMITERVSGIKITAVARDGRNNATPNNSISVKPTYSTPYTAE